MMGRMTLQARGPFALPWCWLCLIAVLGCGDGPPTELLVVVDSDLLPGVELAMVEVATFTLADPDHQSAHSFAIRPSGDTEGETFPFSLSVIPKADMDLSLPVRVDVTGFGPGGSPIVRYAVNTRFRSGLSLRVPAPLARACAYEEACTDADATCSDGVCVAFDVDEATLESVRPGRELTPLFDGPTRPEDAGLPDGGPDADVCAAGAPCEGVGRCEVGELSCDPMECVVTGTLPEGTDCGSGRVCDTEGRCGTH